MRSAVYYNEIDAKAARWLTALIVEGELPSGLVDTRSIADVLPDELAGYNQCHFFAGIGGWPKALEMAGWPQGVEIWSGSCPCQPFSSAGKQKGFADERHLWPVFFDLIRKRRPRYVVGEQVAGTNGEIWFDAVQNGMEKEGYACGAVTFPACSVGAPHLRQRLYWFGVADPRRDTRKSRQPRENIGLLFDRNEKSAGGVADDEDPGSQRRGRYVGQYDTDRRETEKRCDCPGSFWDESRWIGCRDGKVRQVPIEPAFFPLADGVSARVVRLRGYGNAVVLPQAVEFVSAVMDILGLESERRPKEIFVEDDLSDIL